MFDWDETQEDGKLVARLAGTTVTIYGSRGGAPGPWTWEVQFADGQVQVGYAEDPDDAMEKGKKVAERFLA